MMKLAILKETLAGEARVAATPDTVKKLISLGLEVSVEKDAGAAAQFSDAAYKEAGAIIAEDAKSTLAKAQLVLKIHPPYDNAAALSAFPKGATLISLNSPFTYPEEIRNLAGKQINAFGLEMLPRITRAQGMDVLSSQSNLAGYRAVIEAVRLSQKVIPMMMTAAGTIKPAKVLVLGAGVAGLQAIATAKRLGAVVSAFDVRPAVKEQVESLGAGFIEVPALQSGEAEGGYAKEMDDDYKQRQNARIAEVIQQQDIVITTALIPGKAAPILITRDMVKSMRAGAVIIDLAASAGGNCEMTQKGKTVIKHGVTIYGEDHILQAVAQDASQLFATNCFNFVKHLLKKDEDNRLIVNIDLEDEIISNTLLVWQGKLLHKLIGEKPVLSGERKASSPQRKARTSTAAPKKVTQRKPHVKKQESSRKAAPSEWNES